jgi:hypothetical protein
MKIVTNRPVAQGDMLIIPIKTIPGSAKAAVAEGKHFILAHSETGHHHVIERTKAEVYEAADDAFIAYVKALALADITHQRPFDTHETVQLTPGNYEVRRQREYMPEGFRKAQD